MKTFEVPAKHQLSGLNQSIFRNLESSLGFVPNLYALLAHSENGLARHLSSNGSRNSLTVEEKQVIHLVVSQHSKSIYCQNAYSFFARLNSLSEKQITAVLNGTVTAKKTKQLIEFTKKFLASKGKMHLKYLTPFFKAGYTQEHIIDIALLSGEIIAINYIHNLARLPHDFKGIEKKNITRKNNKQTTKK